MFLNFILKINLKNYSFDENCDKKYQTKRITYFRDWYNSPKPSLTKDSLSKNDSPKTVYRRQFIDDSLSKTVYRRQFIEDSLSKTVYRRQFIDDSLSKTVYRRQFIEAQFIDYCLSRQFIEIFDNIYFNVLCNLKKLFFDTFYLIEYIT